VLAQLRAGNVQGLNVTIPHKRTITGFLDALTPTATAVGAVNTVFREGATLVGDNTDAPGCRAALERFLRGHFRRSGAGCSALILGAGGSARAVAYALGAWGWDVTLAARRLEQARRLAGDLAEHHIHVVDYADLSTAVRDRLAACDLIVNATPVGMAPQTDASPWPGETPFPRKAAFYDLVYVPSLTRAVRDARAEGLPAATGLEMLIDQALLSFARWTGCTAPRDALRNAVRHQLEVVQCSDS
jgi:shikimate dehydrogenase